MSHLPSSSGSGAACDITLDDAEYFGTCCTAFVHQNPPHVLILYQGALLSLFTLPFALYYWVWPSVYEWIAFVVIGVLAYGGQYCNIMGYRVGEASFIAPFDYSRIIIAGLLGYWVFAEVPEWNTWLGAALIIGASLFTIYREMTLKKRANRVANEKAL